jgi:uncharacterized protein YdeI (YjbR/CyaY-like superfamily)
MKIIPEDKSMNTQPFIGIGHNPDGPDLPVGLGMQLAQEPQAMETFGEMSNSQKETAIQYIQSSVTGEDTKIRMAEVVEKLKNGQTQF